MLEELSVRNYALIDNLTLSFEDGLNIISGETGAGKSIIVGSLGFLLGAKADAGCVRTGAEEAGVSAVILVPEEHTEARCWLAAREIALEDSRIVVRRALKTNGRGSIYMQNIPVNRADLVQFMALLFDIHGQHDHESLLRRETHRRYLDRFAGIEGETAEFNRLFLSLAEKRKSIEAAQSSTREREARIELLSFSVDEIEKAQLKSGESRELEAEAARLASFEKLAALIESVSQSFFEEGASALNLSRKARSALESAVTIDSALSPLEQRLSALYFEADDLAGELRSYRNKLSFDPARLEFVEERLAFIHKLKKKYAGKSAFTPDTGDEGQGSLFSTVEESILAYKDAAAAEIEALSTTEENREKLKAEAAALELELARQARALSAKRAAAGAELSPKITAVLRRLGMPGAGFTVRLDVKSGESESADKTRNRIILGPYGADDVEFLISANAGEPEKELARIASGGELSRVMLAIKTALSDDSASGLDASPDTLIFDEIDTGIGGEVAITVGAELRNIARRRQVFCVTHLASIACRAGHHLLVEKNSDGARTMTTVRSLSPAERTPEIARMLSGDKGSVALAHAEALLAKYGAEKNLV